MNYNPKNQYRCTIIRGKAKSDLDNLLPLYVNIIISICPCSYEDFKTKFDDRLSQVISGEKKTLDNHRTEIAGKLFGLYYKDGDTVMPSERAMQFSESEDTPQLFKDICIKFQFPNGMDKIQTIEDRIKQKIKLRPFAYILELLTRAKEQSMAITKNEIAYFVLNNLDVLQGWVNPDDVLQSIKQHKEQEIEVKVETEGKASSYSMQHINEQMNILELANLVRINNGVIYLNPYEKTAIDQIRNTWNQPLEFDIYKYDLISDDDKKRLANDWQVYFGTISKENTSVFITSLDALSYNIQKPEKKPIAKPSYLQELGDDGEEFVYNYEIERVSKYDSRLTNKVHSLGKTKGIGYDIQSIFADRTPQSEYVKYIEVKSTKRVTLPTESPDGWIDGFTITRNEWVAAEQHTKSYSFYRVTFTPDKTIIQMIDAPFLKNQDGTLKCTPINYRVDLSLRSIDNIVEKEN